ncbi:MAG: tetratricopeptide repeat protein, partial [Symbiobacteriaceae bacterium]
VVMLNISRCYRLLGDIVKAEEAARQTIDNLGDDCPPVMRSQALIAWAHTLVSLDRATEACEVLEEALRINRQRSDHLSVAAALNNLGVAALAAGQFDRAEQALTESCSLISGPGHRLLTFNYTELGRRRGTQAARNSGPNLGLPSEVYAEAYQRVFPQVTQELS